MVSTLKAKSQVTIPASIVREAGLKVGDAFDIAYKNGNIILTPMVYVSKKDAKALSFLNEVDKRYEGMLDGNFEKHDLIEV